ncbi:short-chain dehydrogenase/reductase [Mycobacterium conspicuum]|uniref:Short-chain dehydrogenase/reductase n=1 Tax=Mycobacterium conspicuum TaxID=44010 RepID=A0A7I7YLU4_9MYCO|nr:short-chain dehydrogenase/reductase [Mycobacterium conspicuum]
MITGANRGIGRAIATEFARRGHHVIATARDPRTLADLTIGEEAGQRLRLDVTDDTSVAAAVAAAGQIDVVIANAGAIIYAAVEATPLPELQRLLNLNTVAAVRLAQAVLPQMRARGDGKLMFMSSVLGRVVRPPSAAYAASKWALEALVEALAIEVAPFGVQAALLEPGAVSSGALDDVTTYTLPDDPYAAILRGGGPRSGMITPEQVAAEVADAAAQPHLPLRVPIGDAARALLAARHAAPDDAPFLAASKPP